MKIMPYIAPEVGQEVGLINEIQKSVKANKVFSFLSGKYKEQKTED